jgi:hypothetical protein
MDGSSGTKVHTHICRTHALVDFAGAGRIPDDSSMIDPLVLRDATHTVCDWRPQRSCNRPDPLATLAAHPAPFALN